MTHNNQPEREAYKSIVTVMSVFIPIGILLGILKGNVLLGLLAGNALGFATGVTVLSFKKELTRNSRD